jgi:hypothetical protein
MSANNIHSISNYLNDQNPGVVFQYDYERSFEDKVYVSEVVDQTILSMCFNLIDAANTKMQLNSDELSLALSQEINLQLSRALNTTVKNAEFSKDSENNSSDIWAINQSKDDIIPLHSSNGEISFILFANDFNKSEESGGYVEFVSSRSNNTMKFIPEPGNIFIFNSRHLRMIYPHYEQKDRIIILGNIDQFEIHV